MTAFHAGGASLVGLGEVVMILELHRQGLSVSAIARLASTDVVENRRGTECAGAV